MNSFQAYSSTNLVYIHPCMYVKMVSSLEQGEAHMHEHKNQYTSGEKKVSLGEK